MKIKIGKSKIGVPNKSLKNQLLRCKAQTFTPKKGKGSFKRNPKHKGRSYDGSSIFIMPYPLIAQE